MRNPFADLDKHRQKYIDWRRHLHRNPELSDEETNTTAFVCERLKEAGISYETLGGGVVARLDPSQTEAKAPAIGLRADTDALPICETNDFAHRSVNEGVMHACGHDGHTAMLLAAADFLSLCRDQLAGPTYFVFQPAEEIGFGARRMIEAGLFKKFPMQRIFGLHNWPGLKTGHFAVFPAKVMAAVDVFDIEILGKGGHAAIPHETTDALLAAAHFISSAQTLVSRNINPMEAGILSFTACEAGENYNVLPSRVKLKGTLRYFNEEVHQILIRGLRRQLLAICRAHGVTGKLACRVDSIATVNEKNSAEFCESVIRSIPAYRVRGDLLPSTAAEDFAYMLKAVPGCYVWLGNGNSASLHMPNYDFNDEILTIGVRYWCALSCQPRH